MHKHFYDSTQQSLEINIDPDASGLDLEDLANAGCLRVGSRPEHRLIALTGERGLGAEKIRILGTRLRHMQRHRPVKVLLVTSSVKNEGKSLLSANLSLALSRMQQRVLLIDGDCHQPALARLFGAPQSSGLSNWWSSTESIATYLRKIAGFPLWFLPAGTPMSDSLAMLQSPRLSKLFSDFSDLFEWIIVDSPPFAPLADSAVWTTLADGILLLVRQGITPSKVLGEVLSSIDRQKLLGFVMNDVLDPNRNHYLEYYEAGPTTQS